MRISDWSSDVCSSDLPFAVAAAAVVQRIAGALRARRVAVAARGIRGAVRTRTLSVRGGGHGDGRRAAGGRARCDGDAGTIPSPACGRRRSEEHTSELQSIMRTSYAVFCLIKQKQKECTLM